VRVHVFFNAPNLSAARENCYDLLVGPGPCFLGRDTTSHVIFKLHPPTKCIVFRVMVALDERLKVIASQQNYSSFSASGNYLFRKPEQLHEFMRLLCVRRQEIFHTH
jgi:hypothetical protein